MAAGKQQQEMTKLGFYSLTPFVVPAAALWISPFILPQHIALDFHQLALVYGAVIVAYLSGAGAGVTLAPPQKLRESFIPGQLIALVAFVAVIPDGVLFMWLGAAWRHLIILLLLIYLLMRDMNAASAGLFPKWYGALRLRLTFWAGLSILLIVSRLLMWGFY